MRTKACRAMAVGAAIAVLWTGSAADQGLADIHDQVRVGGKICFKDHSHYGEGTGRTRAQAQAEAARAWAGFTGWEYGSSWGSYALAEGKSMRCSTGPSGWSCATEARPCRRR